MHPSVLSDISPDRSEAELVNSLNKKITNESSADRRKGETTRLEIEMEMTDVVKVQMKEEEVEWFLENKNSPPDEHWRAVLSL